jgi:RNA polymerase sigma-70 factor (ECF subfamily)
VESLINPTDNDLIRETLAGNPQAFEGLVRRYQGRLLSAMVAVCGAIQEAEDVVQETFLQAYCKLESFRSESRFYTWLYRIAFNLSVNARRRKRPALAADHYEGAQGVEAADHGPGPEEPLAQAERSQQVLEAIQRLPDEFRQVLVLRELEGFCYETIAEVLALPIGTVRSRLHRARQQLKDELQTWFAD